MKKHITILICLILLVASVSFLQATEMKMPDYKKVTLDNGLDVYVIEQHETPVVYVQLVIPGGTCFDTDETAGLTNLTSGLLRKGTTTRTADEIAQAIDFVGGSLGAGAGKDAITANTMVLSKHLDTGLELLADIIMHPVFAEEEVERLKEQTVAGIMQAKSDPGTIRNQQFDKIIYGDHPYGLPAAGTQESIFMLTADDVKEFYNKYFIPNNAFMMIIGDVQADAVIGKIKTYFGGWKMGTAPEFNFPQPAPLEGRKVILIDKPDATQSYIALGHHGISRLDSDAFHLRVLNYILGGGGFQSRLTKNVRGESGLTYGISSSFDFNKYPGEFVVATFTKNESTSEAIDKILDEMETIRKEPVSMDELTECQSFYSGYIPLQFETPAQIASYVQTILLYELPMDYYTTYLKEVNTATQDDILKLAQKYLSTENLLIVVVGKAEDVKVQLEKYGPVQVIPMIEL